MEWRYSATDPALFTAIGRKTAQAIQIDSKAGCGLFGPYIDLESGFYSARIIFDGPCEGKARIDFSAETGSKIFASRSVNLEELSSNILELSVLVPNPLSGCEVRLLCEDNVHAAISALELDFLSPLDPARPVGFESRKSYAEYISNGFLAKYLSGKNILEIGYKGYINGVVPIVPHAIGIDLDYPGYDGIRLPFADASQDAIYSSHSFEHIADYVGALQDWYRVLKVGGYLIVVVPHQYLFEKRTKLPSIANGDHKRFYTPSSLLSEIEEALIPNSYRIRHLADNDRGYDYSCSPKEDSHGCYEIELVVEKIKKPNWNLDDGTLRSYGANEFLTRLKRVSPWWLEIDFSITDICLIWGPFVRLEPGEYEAEFSFEPTDFNGQDLSSELVFDIGQNADRIETLSLLGSEGARILQAGSAKLRFTNSIPGSYFEFRIFSTGKPFEGRLKFHGVTLRQPM